MLSQVMLYLFYSLSTERNMDVLLPIVLFSFIHCMMGILYGTCWCYSNSNSQIFCSGSCFRGNSKVINWMLKLHLYTNEGNALRYASGYIVSGISQKISKGNHASKVEITACLNSLVKGRCDDGFDQGIAEEWTNLVSCKVEDEC